MRVNGYAGHNRLTGRGRKGGAPLRLAYCWSRARRRLRKIYDSSGSEIATEGLRRIAELYAIEADIRCSSSERRRSERQTCAAPLGEAFGVWLKQQRARVSPKRRLGEKLAYIAYHWEGLRLFLADGRVEMDSNAVENLNRPTALTRKNALFAGPDKGAVAWGRIASRTQTAWLNGVEPYAQLKVTLEAISVGHPNDRIDNLAP
ncbi:MAG: transposase [Chloroflexi bacterium]|nr:transposase [Chloroflexota bacterium]